MTVPHSVRLYLSGFEEIFDYYLLFQLVYIQSKNEYRKVTEITPEDLSPFAAAKGDVVPLWLELCRHIKAMQHRDDFDNFMPNFAEQKSVLDDRLRTKFACRASAYCLCGVIAGEMRPVVVFHLHPSFKKQRKGILRTMLHFGFDLVMRHTAE